MEQERFQSLIEQLKKKQKSMETMFETLTTVKTQNVAGFRKTSKELDSTLADRYSWITHIYCLLVIA